MFGFLLTLSLLATFLLAALPCSPAWAQGSQGITVSVAVAPCVRVAADGSVRSNIPVSAFPALDILTVLAR